MSPPRIAGIAVAAAVLLGLSWASVAPMRMAASDTAIIRLSIAARPERIETCRTVSDDELAKLAPQMRQPVVCEGTTARYRLELHRDGEPLLSQVLRGGGLRHDRRMYVLREIAIPPGNSIISVSLARIDTVAAAREAPDTARDRDAARRQRAREAAVPPALRLEIDRSIGPGEVLLVTYEPEQRRLVAR